MKNKFFVFFLSFFWGGGGNCAIFLKEFTFKKVLNFIFKGFTVASQITSDIVTRKTNAKLQKKERGRERDIYL